MGCPHKLLLLLGQVARKALDALGAHPYASIRNFDVGKNVRDGELGL
jgi:hypothetical protein